jgi:hypothetical protein
MFRLVNPRFTLANTPTIRGERAQLMDSCGKFALLLRRGGQADTVGKNELGGLVRQLGGDKRDDVKMDVRG